MPKQPKRKFQCTQCGKPANPNVKIIRWTDYDDMDSHIARFCSDACRDNFNATLEAI